ncbi:MAG: hypothetical protein HQM13_11140 [SAR324 cluster bacterium]|nr:hypothetical protein [SAR324 cluster bacterium]
MKAKNYMKQIMMVLVLTCFLFPAKASSQETGPLMMGVEIGYTLGGMLAGVAAGGVVWLTDPGGPTPIITVLKDGAILGTLLGAITGFYLIYNSTIDPNAAPQPDNFQDLLGEVPFSASEKKYHSNAPGITLTLIHYKF